MSFLFVSVITKYLYFATFSNDSLAILIFWCVEVEEDYVEKSY